MSNTDTAFIWADLSSPAPDRAAAFLTSLIGWTFAEEAGYRTALMGGTSVAGLYETPQKFQGIGMPSFWMSYVGVDAVAPVVAAARAAGGRVELEADDYALIRDPLGAGFTVHERWRNSAAADVAGNDAGHRVGHALHCEDVAVVAPFYHALFGWRFDQVAEGVFDILSGQRRIAGALTLSETVRGPHNYWAVLFRAPSLDGIGDLARAKGGAAERLGALPEGEAVALTDPQGAVLVLVDANRAPIPERAVA